MMQDKYIDQFDLFDESAYFHDCEVYVNYMKNLITVASKICINQRESHGFNSYSPLKQARSLFGQEGILENENENNSNEEKCSSSFTKTPSSTYEPIRISKVLRKPITKKVTIIIDDSKSIGEEEESTTEGILYLQKKTNRCSKKCSECPHKDAKHYAKVSFDIILMQ